MTNTRRTYFCKFLLSVFTLVATTALVGCAATGAPFTGIAALPEGKAQLYLYRKFAQSSALDPFPVHLDKVPVGDLFNAPFMVLPLTPGVHIVRVKPTPWSSTYEHTLAIAANQTQYIEFVLPGFRLGDVHKYGSKMTPRDAEQAKADLRELKAVK